MFAGHLSIFTLTIITVERWFAITVKIEKCVSEQFFTVNFHLTACHILEQKVEIQDRGKRHGKRVDLLDSDGRYAFVRHIELFINEVSRRESPATVKKRFLFVRNTFLKIST